MGGLKATLGGLALMFTGVYLKWMEKELYSNFGNKRGFKSE
jgi:hypothetical protein